jgi:peptide/nickel transport system permease protein
MILRGERRLSAGRRSRAGRSHGSAVVILRAARTRRGAFGLVVAGSVVAFAALGPLIAPHSPTAFVTLPYAKPSGHALLGGDTLGRDVLSRVLNGGWVLLLMASAATIVGVGLGTIAGVTAAYLRGVPETLIMRSVDVILAFPQLVFALLLVSIVGPKLWLIVLAVGFSHAPQVARVLHSAAVGVSERPFIKATELNGVRPLRIMVGGILPNLVTPIVVEAGLRMTFSIVVMAGLSFLGFGQAPPAPSWGYMISENRLGLALNPWGVVVPAALIALLTVGTNTFGDAVARVSIGAAGRPSEVALAGAAIGAAGAPDELAGSGPPRSGSL